MQAIQLTNMLATLRGILQENPQGVSFDAEMVAALVGGLRDMERAAEAQQQMIVTLEEQLAECGQAPLYRPVAPVQDNVIPFPIVPRPVPLHGGAA